MFLGAWKQGAGGIYFLINITGRFYGPTRCGHLYTAENLHSHFRAISFCWTSGRSRVFPPAAHGSVGGFPAGTRDSCNRGHETCYAARMKPVLLCLVLLVACGCRSKTTARAAGEPKPPQQSLQPANANFQLHPDDRLTLISDGIVEAADGHLFGFERVNHWLRVARSASDIAAAVQAFGQQDDISVISVTRAPVAEPALA